MPTPASGTISMNDMRTEINRATSSSISMQEMRTRYGGSGAISFSDLYDTEGFQITVGSETSKFGTANGWSREFGAFGNINPEESGSLGLVQFAANSYALALASDVTGNVYISISHVNNALPNGDLVTSGYKTTDLTRMVMANTSYSIISATSNSSVSLAYIGTAYTFPANGTVIHCLVKF
jgi:hypothetical protein